MPIVQLTEGENQLKTVHRHLISFFGDIFSITIFILLPIIFAVLLLLTPNDFTDSLFAGDTSVGILFVAVTWILIAWLFAWFRWTDYFLDVMVITDKRIFEVKQNGFWNREVTSFGIDRVENIKVTQVGILASLLNYGDILVETASENENLHLTYVPNPNDVKKLINELQDHDKLIHA